MGILEQASNDPVLRQLGHSQQQRFKWGVVKSVDSLKQTMEVQLAGSDNKVTVAINNNVTIYGLGMRFMPIPEATRVIIDQAVVGQYMHAGYYMEGVGDFSDDSVGSKSSSDFIMLQRYLENGELELVGSSNNEIFLSKDGSIYLKTQFGDFIRLENYTSTIEASAANLNFNLDKVRIRAGNVRRPVSTVTDDEHMVVIDDVVKKESEVEEDEQANAKTIKEFHVQVGVEQKSSDSYRDDPETSPSVGYIYMGERLIRENGTEEQAAGGPVKCRIMTKEGGGIQVTQDGSVYIMDRAGGDGTLFQSSVEAGPEGGNKSFRVGNNFVNISADRISLIHQSGSMIEIDSTTIVIKHANGRYIELNGNSGLMLGFPEAIITQQAKTINLMGDINFGMMPTDKLLAAGLFAGVYDIHTHAGPSGPPVALLTPMVQAGTVAVAGINVSV